MTSVLGEIGVQSTNNEIITELLMKISLYEDHINYNAKLFPKGRKKTHSKQKNLMLKQMSGAGYP